MGNYRGVLDGVTKGHTRSLDYNSCRALFTRHVYKGW